uniref:Prostaglandin E synthase 3 n=1 Tax=Bos indicus x Bos taurus TaxID=30522 RepID=A0A4W2E888_BOBOX
MGLEEGPGQCISTLAVLKFTEEKTSTSRPLERLTHPLVSAPALFTIQPASPKWYNQRNYVFIEFCVEDSQDVNVNFENSKLTFSCLGGIDHFKHLNEIDLLHCIDPNNSKHKRTDRSILYLADMSNFNRFSEMMNNMGGDENVDLPEVHGAGDDSQDSDEKKMPDLE